MSVNKIGCSRNKCDKYFDCSGKPFCICTKIEPIAVLPYLIPPLGMPFTTGSQLYYRAKLGQDSYKKKGVAYVHLSLPLRVGDILKIQNTGCIDYYLRKKLPKKDNFNRFVYEIRRVDEIRISYLDLRELTKGKTVLVTGYFTDNKKQH